MATILIVDDNDLVRKTLEWIVQRMGHQVVSTSEPLDAITLATSSVPDVALLDYCMPGIDGVSLLGVMRDVLGHRCPPTLFISASPPDEEVTDAIGVGHAVLGVIQKPFRIEDVRAAIEDALAASAVAPPFQPPRERILTEHVVASNERAIADPFKPEIVSHNGCEMWRLDYCRVPLADLPAQLEGWLAEITRRPRASIRVMVVPCDHFAGAAEQIRAFGERATPHTLALALVTANPFHRALMWAMAANGPRHVAAFDTEDAARDWLSSIDDHAGHLPTYVEEPAAIALH